MMDIPSLSRGSGALATFLSPRERTFVVFGDNPKHCARSALNIDKTSIWRPIRDTKKYTR